jgi:hypothetical protein
MKFWRATIITILYLVVYAAVYLVHVSYFQVDVVFYSTLFDALIALLITATVFSLSRHFRIFNRFEKMQMLLIWLALGYILAITGPTVIDRSLSFYILEKIQQRGGGIRQDAFEAIFAREFIREHRLVDVRLTEQLESGTITIDDGCVELTAWGDFLATSSRYFRNHFLPKKRQLMGEISDHLTDPFRNSDDDVQYSCGDEN